MLLFAASAVLAAVTAVMVCFVVKVSEWRQEVLYGTFLRRDDGSELR